MAHACSESHPERCINPNGSLCAAWEARIGNGKRSRGVTETTTDPALIRQRITPEHRDEGGIWRRP